MNHRPHPWRTWLRPPQQLLARLRWFFLLFALFFLVTFTPQVLLESSWPLPVRLSTVGAMAVLGWWWVRCHGDGRFPAAGLVLEVAAFVAVVLTPADPFKSLGLLYIAVNFRALYGSWRQVAGFTVLAVVTFSAAVLWAPELGLMDRTSLLPYTLPGVPVLAGIAHLVSVASSQSERAVARERTLSSAGLAFALAADASAVRRAALAAAAALLSDVPDARVDLLTGGRVPAEPVRDGVRLDLPLRSRTGTIGTLSVVSHRPLAPDVSAALRALAAQVALGLHNVALTADLIHRATHDPLTDLANRTAVVKRLDQALADEEAASGGCAAGVGVLLLDLDGFKGVNDTLGHAAGDQLLRTVAQRMTAEVRAGDLVGRLGGDEFVVLLPGLAGPEETRAMADRLTATITRPVDVGGRTVTVGVSVGCAVGVRGAQSAELLRQADAAMYGAKGARRRGERRTGEPANR